VHGNIITRILKFEAMCTKTVFHQKALLISKLILHKYVMYSTLPPSYDKKLSKKKPQEKLKVL